jgi:hypothetical protein
VSGNALCTEGFFEAPAPALHACRVEAEDRARDDLDIRYVVGTVLASAGASHVQTLGLILRATRLLRDFSRDWSGAAAQNSQNFVEPLGVAIDI